MNILVSVYACEPNKGSEPGGGWNWVLELSRRGYNVFVITRANNKENIERFFAKSTINPKITFVYHDLPKFIIKLKKFFKFTRIYYILWQFSIFDKCKKLNSKYKFDVIHHITFGSIRHFSLLSELNTKTFIGPLGGAETSPLWLRRHIGIQGAISDTFRDIINLVTYIDPFFLRAIKKCNKVIFTTHAGIKYCPKKYRDKIQICLFAGLNNEQYHLKKTSVRNQKKILFVGRHLHWKGMKIGIEAFRKALEIDPDLKLTIVGSGNATKYWKKLVDKYEISKTVSWISWLPRNECEKIYSDHGIFIFPSLHDSGGFVVLEALKNGLPVICFDLGGPAYMVDKFSGIKIKTNKKDYIKLINEFSKEINLLSSDKEYWELYSKGAYSRSKDFIMRNLVSKIYE